MARQPKPPPGTQTKFPLSKLARYMLSFHGEARLKMIREEHEAGLPPQMSNAEREMRIAAITELIPKPKNY